jgi:cell division protease FtsH
LILEDIDLYGEDRGHVHDSSFLGELMNELDGMVDNQEIIVIATTNHLEKVENALRNRPGRFDRVYKIPNPDLTARRNLLAHFIARTPNNVAPAEVDRLAELFSGYSGAYLKELVNSGFAHSIIRDPLKPLLTVEDLNACVDVLKNNEKRSPLGFAAVNQAIPREALGAGVSQNKNV